MLAEKIRKVLKKETLSAADCLTIFRALLEQKAVFGGKLWTDDDIISEYTELTGKELKTVPEALRNEIKTNVFHEVSYTESGELDRAIREYEARPKNWYHFRHGLGPGTMPNGVNIVMVINDGEKDFVQLSRTLTEEEMSEYDIVEHSLRKFSSHDACVICEEIEAGAAPLPIIKEILELEQYHLSVGLGDPKLFDKIEERNNLQTALSTEPQKVISFVENIGEDLCRFESEQEQGGSDGD